MLKTDKIFAYDSMDEFVNDKPDFASSVILQFMPINGKSQCEKRDVKLHGDRVIFRHFSFYNPHDSGFYTIIAVNVEFDEKDKYGKFVVCFESGSSNYKYSLYDDLCSVLDENFSDIGMKNSELPQIITEDVRKKPSTHLGGG